MKNRVYTNTQPLFFPAIYMMERFYRSEAIVLMDEAQYHRKGHHSRCEIGGASGPFTFSLPVKKANREPINRVQLHEPHKHLSKLKSAIELSYRKAPYFDQYWPLIRGFIEAQICKSESLILSDLNYEITELALQLYGITHARVYRSTDLVDSSTLTGSEWMAVLGGVLGMNTYYSGGVGIHAYVDKRDFDYRGLRLQAQDYILPDHLYCSGISAPHAGLFFLDPLFYLGQDTAKKLFCN